MNDREAVVGGLLDSIVARLSELRILANVAGMHTHICFHASEIPCLVDPDRDATSSDKLVCHPMMKKHTVIRTYRLHGDVEVLVSRTATEADIERLSHSAEQTCRAHEKKAV